MLVRPHVYHEFFHPRGKSLKDRWQPDFGFFPVRVGTGPPHADVGFGLTWPESKEESQTICCCRALSRGWQTRSPSGERIDGPQTPDQFPKGRQGFTDSALGRGKLLGLSGAYFDEVGGKLVAAFSATPVR